MSSLNSCSWCCSYALPPCDLLRPCGLLWRCCWCPWPFHGHYRCSCLHHPVCSPWPRRGVPLHPCSLLSSRSLFRYARPDGPACPYSCFCFHLAWLFVFFLISCRYRTARLIAE